MSKENSSQETKAMADIADFLIQEFNVPESDISVYIDRDIVAYQAGKEVTCDKIQIDIANPVLDKAGEIVHSMPMQHKLADKLADIWKKKVPMLSVNAPLPIEVVDVETKAKASDKSPVPENM